MTNSARCLAALSALGWLGCVGPPVQRETLEGWQAVETGGVRIVAQARGEEVDALAQDLASFRAAFRFLIGRELVANGPTTIVMIRNSALARRFGLGGGAAGYAITSFDGSFAWLQLGPSRFEN